MNKYGRDFVNLPHHGAQAVFTHMLSSSHFPQAIMPFLFERVEEAGYVNFFNFYQQPGSDELHWAFSDFGKRYAPADGKLLGYEVVSYPASQAGVDFFAPVYLQMRELERTASGEQGKAVAQNYFDKQIAATGKCYDELAHTLQQS